MTKCKNCETEEQGYGTLLDKRGYCYKPYCQSRSYDEVEQQDSHIRFDLDRQIKINRKLVEALKLYAEPDCLYYIATRKEDFYKLAQKTLKEIDKTNEFITNPQDCESIAEDAFAEARKTYEENKRLKVQLDREIHTNRKLVKTLKKYVLPENYEGGMGKEYENMCIECKEVLKEIGE